MPRKSTEGRRQRIGFGAARTRLQMSKEEVQAMEKDGYRPYWFNDEYGAVEQALAAGYEFVRPDEARSIGQSELHEGNTDLGGRVSKIVTKGNPPVRAYLMKQKIKHYEEDARAREEKNALVEKTLRSSGGADIENQYGDVSITRG